MARKRAREHYHAPGWNDVARGEVISIEHVYRERRDADDCFEDTKLRAERPDTPFSPEHLKDARVRPCSDPACIGD